MGTEHNWTVFNCLCSKSSTKILAIFLIIFLLSGKVYGLVNPSFVYSSKEDVYWAQTPGTDFPSSVSSSTPLSSESEQTLKIAATNPSISSEISNLAFSIIATARSVINDTIALASDQTLSLDPILLSSSNYFTPTSSSSSYLISDQTMETYLNYNSKDIVALFNSTFDEIATPTITSHPLLFQSNITILPTRVIDGELVYLTNSYVQPNTNTNSTLIEQPQEDIKETFEKAAESVLMASTPPNWEMNEASPATVVQGAMTWVTSQPSSSSHLQSEFHLPAGTVAGIVVASIAFIGLIAAVLGCLALKRFRSYHAKTYENTYANDTFSYLDNLQVSYINHHVELPKESSDEMFSLDNDSFLNSLEAMTMENYWADDSKSTKV
ncbi:hypothetical protein CHUAL_000337 [Chamberlinius hualienensis]